MQELTNMSVYPMALEPFGSWDRALDFYRGLGIDGLEVLTAFDGAMGVPPEAVTAVHLPYWMDWMSLWTGRESEPLPLPEEDRILFRGGSSREDLIRNVRGHLSTAASLDPAYAVYHANNVTVNEVFTGRQANGAHAVLEALAELMNEVVRAFPGGEPPVPIYFENLWWEGLTHTDPHETDFFASSLAFSNWAFLLDTGHLLNTTTQCRTEDDAVDYLMATLQKLPPYLVRRFEGIHLHVSLSGAVRSAPDWYESYPVDDVADRFDRAWDRVGLIDQHRPFATSACRRVVELLNPSYVTHEFDCFTPEERRTAILTQRRALGSCP